MRGYLTFLLPLLLLLSLPVHAAAENSAHMTEFRLPAGDRLIDFCWHHEGGIVLLVENDKGLALRWLDMGKYETYDMSVQAQFTKLKTEGNNGYELEFGFAPDGSYMTAFKRFEGPLRQNDLQVFRLKKEGATWLTTRSIPATFWIDNISWDDASEHLYLSAEPYGSPEQKFSIAAYTPETKGFNGLVERRELDVVHDIEFLHGRNSLAVHCSGINGEYPTEPALVYFSLEPRRFEVIHARAGGLRLAATASGMLLAMNCDKQGKLAASGHWVLGPNEKALRPCELELSSAKLAAHSSRDGRWIGILSSDDGEGRYRLALQRSSDGWSLLSKQVVKNQHFNLESTKVGAADSEGTALYVYWLPEG